MQEVQVPSLSLEDPLEEEMAAQPTPVSLPGKFHGQRNLAGYGPWGLKELNETEHTKPTPAFAFTENMISFFFPLVASI